jgi:hypothetical protein
MVKSVLLIKCCSGCICNSKFLFWCVWCANHPFDSLNSLLSSCLPTSFAYSWSLVQNTGSLLPLTLTQHVHTVSLHSFQVFVSFHFKENLLEFSHWFLIYNMAFNMSYSSCLPPTLNYGTVRFTVNFSFSLASVILLLCWDKGLSFSLEDMAETE